MGDFKFISAGDPGITPFYVPEEGGDLALQVSIEITNWIQDHKQGGFGLLKPKAGEAAEQKALLYLWEQDPWIAGGAAEGDEVNVTRKHVEKVLSILNEDGANTQSPQPQPEPQESESESESQSESETKSGSGRSSRDASQDDEPEEDEPDDGEEEPDDGEEEPDDGEDESDESDESEEDESDDGEDEPDEADSAGGGGGSSSDTDTDADDDPDDDGDEPEDEASDLEADGGEDEGSEDGEEGSEDGEEEEGEGEEGSEDGEEGSEDGEGEEGEGEDIESMLSAFLAEALGEESDDQNDQDDPDDDQESDDGSPWGDDGDESEDGDGDEGEPEEEAGEALDLSELGSFDPKNDASADQETLARILPSQRGYGSTGQDRSVDAKKLAMLAGRFGPGSMWEKFLDLIGRVSAQAYSPPTRLPTAAREDVTDLELSNDLSRTLLSELARFATPQTAVGAYIDYVEKRLLQFAVEGDEPSGRGPILVAVDLSASMMDPSGIRNPAYRASRKVRDSAAAQFRSLLTRARATSQTSMENMSLLQLALTLTIGLVRVADVQKRPIFIVTFAEKVLWSLQASRPADYVDAMLTLSGKIECGWGTDFGPPLGKLLTMTSASPGGDLLLITDGEGRVPGPIGDEINRRRKSAGLRMFVAKLGRVPGDQLQGYYDVCVKLNTEDDLAKLGDAIAAGGAKKKQQDGPKRWG